MQQQQITQHSNAADRCIRIYEWRAEKHQAYIVDDAGSKVSTEALLMDAAEG